MEKETLLVLLFAESSILRQGSVCYMVRWVFNKSNSPFQGDCLSIPALAKSDIASFTTAGVHTTLVLEEAHALRLETVQTGPGKLTILSIRLS